MADSVTGCCSVVTVESRNTQLRNIGQEVSNTPVNVLEQPFLIPILTLDSEKLILKLLLDYYLFFKLELVLSS